MYQNYCFFLAGYQIEIYKKLNNCENQQTYTYGKYLGVVWLYLSQTATTKSTQGYHHVAPQAGMEYVLVSGLKQAEKWKNHWDSALTLICHSFPNPLTPLLP